MDGGMSAAAIEVLVQNLINVFNEEHSLIRGLDEDSEQLQTTLGMIHGYLNDAETKSINHEAIKIWLRKLEVVAFDADNALDELSYHLLRNKVHKMKTPKDKVLSCFSSFNHIAFPRNMAHRIKHINKKFESMNKRATELGLQNIVVNAPIAAPDAFFETDSFTIDPIFIGRVDDVQRLVDLLTESPKERMFSILAIVGMGGMGKSTLTRKVFNHEKMKTRFGSLIWVHVSQSFDPIILFKKIFSTLTSKTTEGVENREVILKMLQEALKAKTYLLVLDDVWNEDVPKWEDFINSIAGVTSTMGNGIIMTTRKENVASTMRPFHIHSLTGLSDEDCWSIIKSKAFENGEDPTGFEIIGRMIAKRCGGLPLAANVVGGVLRCKSKEEWHFVNENRLSDVEGGENISKILKLSFDHLASPSLKKCFTYCSIFPKGKEIEKQELIELWMAEGFLQADQGNNDMESVGGKFLNALLHNSLLLVAKRDDYGNVEKCVMHDLVHDMASSVLGSSNNADGIVPLRYMIQNEPSPIRKDVAKHLRTLFLKGEKIYGKMFSDFECLHVLVLSGYGVRELPNSIRKLVHLRDLNISDTYIRNLPDWIGELHHLQTLNAETEYSMKKFPSTLKYLINLRHLYICVDVMLPAEIGRLTCLQTLKHFRVGEKKGYKIEELGSLNNLKGNLAIRNLENVHDKEEALKANMFQKPNLFDLCFEWVEDREGETNDESVLEGLQPHPNLKKLVIVGFKSKRFPSWTMKMAIRDGPQGSWVGLDKLIEIELSRCKECEEIPMLEHLPNLKSLLLIGLKKVRFINSSFSKLTRLIINGMVGLECLPDWLFHNNPNLSELEITECPKLRELPDGLHNHNSLEKLTIWTCPNLESIGNPSGGGQQQGVLSFLWIKECGELMDLPREIVESWAPSLETLILRGLSSLKNLPMVIDCLAKSSPLRVLRIVDVPKFMATCSVESWPFGSLQYLNIDMSKEWSRESSTAIKETVDGILQGCCHSLNVLCLKGMENWEWMPASIQHHTTLSFLKLENFGVQELAQWFGNLSSLRDFYLSSCNKLRHLPSGDVLERLTELRYLNIKDCPKPRIDSEWHNIPHLEIEVDHRVIKSCNKT